MELKNAIAVCLISLFSATLVVMIVRTLDSQTASRIEPQLASIVKELQAIRKQGGISISPSASIQDDRVNDGLVVYYFYSNIRCPTCQAIETQSHDVVMADFKAQLDRDEMVWKMLNYEEPEGKNLAKKFEIQMPVVVLAKMNAGQIQGWKRLDEVWGLVNNKPAFATFVRKEIQKMLGDASQVSTVEKPQAASPVLTPANLPLPTTPPNLPLPK